MQTSRERVVADHPVLCRPTRACQTGDPPAVGPEAVCTVVHADSAATLQRQHARADQGAERTVIAGIGAGSRKDGIDQAVDPRRRRRTGAVQAKDPGV